jgi:5-methyltetrahydrofolate corrinoid/iron sulfur protein methyltransferase
MIRIADNLHVVNPAVAQALARLDPEPIERLVARCIKAGAQAIDINSGPLKKEPQKYFRFLVEVAQSVTDLPLVLDTTNPEALEAGLQCCHRTPIINGFSLEPARLGSILPLAKRYGADLIGYLLGPKSQVPVEEEEMMAMAVDLFAAFSTTGMAPERLIIDPVITPLSWDNGIRHNQSVLYVIQHLADLLGAPVRTIAGISNLTSGPMDINRKIQLEQAFLPMLASAGLDYALLNIFHRPSVQTAQLCDALLGDKVFVW